MTILKKYVCTILLMQLYVEGICQNFKKGSIDTADILVYSHHVDSISKFSMAIINQVLTPYEGSNIRKPCVGSAIWYDSSGVLMKVVEYRKGTKQVYKSTFYVKDNRLIKAENCLGTDTTLLGTELDENTFFNATNCQTFYFIETKSLKGKVASSEREKLWSSFAVYQFLFERRFN